MVVSPYYTAEIGGNNIPVYASMVFIRADDTGTLHSFSEIYVDPDSDFSFNIKLTSALAKLKNAIVLPESLGVKAECEDGVVCASINKPGIYTFVFNGGKQYYGYTFFVREKVDEEAENFEIKNVEFNNITYTSYLPSKIYGNGNRSNTVAVKVKNVIGNGRRIRRLGIGFLTGIFCDVDFQYDSVLDF